MPAPARALPQPFSWIRSGRLAAEALLPIAHWLTPEGAPKRFATHFFAVSAPPAPDVVVDGGEITDYRWAPAAALLACWAARR